MAHFSVKKTTTKKQPKAKEAEKETPQEAEKETPQEAEKATPKEAKKTTQEVNEEEEEYEEEKKKNQFKPYRLFFQILAKTVKYTMWASMLAYFYHLYVVFNTKKPEEAFGVNGNMLEYA